VFLLINIVHRFDLIQQIVDVAMGLEYQHKERVVHGDLKAVLCGFN
jgi:hypothetical protein